MNEREAEHVRQNSIMMKQKREDKTGITRRKVMFLIRLNAIQLYY